VAAKRVISRLIVIVLVKWKIMAYYPV